MPFTLRTHDNTYHSPDGGTGPCSHVELEAPMRRSTKHPILAAGLAAALMFSAVACGSDSDGGGGETERTPRYENLAALAGKRIGVQSDTTGQSYAEANTPEGAEIVSFDDTVGLFGALASGDIDAILQDLPVNAGRVAEDGDVAVVETD